MLAMLGGGRAWLWRHSWGLGNAPSWKAGKPPSAATSGSCSFSSIAFAAATCTALLLGPTCCSDAPGLVIPKASLRRERITDWHLSAVGTA